MKRLTLLNAEISRAVASLGHGDLFVLADAGHAIPRGADRIDIALRPGVPSMLEVLGTVLTELRAEAYVVCDEIATANPHLDQAYRRALTGVERVALPYADFRALVHDAKSVIRTGEVTAHANLILRATGTT
jgi:D-ribose pyranase